METMKNVTYETEEGDMLFAVACEAMEELDKAQKHQDRWQDEMEATLLRAWTPPPGTSPTVGRI